MRNDTPAFSEPLHVGRPNLASPEKFIELVNGALSRKWLSNDGPLVRELEAQVANYLGVKHCVAITNGTIALEIAIKVAGLTGEVIVPSWTFIATVHALRWLGVTPVFADIDPETHCLDPESVRRKITDRTTGILAVHLWGRPAPVAELEAVARERSLTLIYDAAHAFGVSAEDKMIGNFGKAEILSFHATKFFNAIEGGAIVTNDDEFATRARLMRNFGFVGEDHVVIEGTNGKMSEISAAMGLANFGGLADLIDVNRANYDAYVRGVSGLPGLRVLEIDARHLSNYQYVVLLVEEDCPATRDDILAELRRNNVLARRYFWPACHRMEPYKSLDPEAGADLPETERISDQVVVLPTGTAVNVDEIGVIVDILRNTVEASVNHRTGGTDGA